MTYHASMFQAHRRTLLLLATAWLFGPRAAVAQTRPAADSLLVRVHAGLLEVVRASDPQLRALRSGVEATRAAQRAAGRAPAASIDAGLSDGPGGDVAAGNLTVTASRPILLGPRRAAARAAAQTEVGIAELDVEAHERALSLVLLRDLADAVGATLVLRRLSTSDAWLASAEEALGARFAAGTARFLDVLRVRTERLQVAAERSDAIADRAAALAALRARVGPSRSSAALAAAVDSAASADDVRAWLFLLGEVPAVDSLVRWSEVVRSASAAQRRAVAERDGLLADQRAQLIGAAGLQRIGPANGGPSVGIVLGASATWPYSVRRGLSAAREAADSGVVAMGARAVAAHAAATANAETALARDVAARERVALFSGVLLGAVESEREAAIAQYRNGEMSLLELLDLERSLLRLEIARARAITAAAAARASLFGLDP